VITMYSKMAGKNRKHKAVTDSSKISTISNLGIQVFQNTIANYFSTASPQAIVLLTHTIFSSSRQSSFW
ncbi:hypothetical protein BDQ17DRAFT_1260999, partial [Cyathus striatus]